MCIITALTVGLGMGITSALGMTAASTTTAMVAGAIGTTMVAGAVAGVAGAAVGIVGSVQSARASAEMQRRQAEQLKQMQDNSGEPDVARVNNGLQDNSRKARTLSSLRIGLLPQAQPTEEITRNVYGVDTNQVTTSTQNMVGLNIAAA